MAKVTCERGNQQQLDEPNEDERVSWQVIIEPFKDVRKVLTYKQQPPKISLVYLRNCLRLLGILSNDALYSKVIYIFIVFMMFLFGFTIMCDLCDVYSDILLFGEDAVFAAGVYLVLIKILLNAYNADDIEQITYEFIRMNKHFSRMNESRSFGKIRKVQRYFFLLELITFFFYGTMSTIVTIAFCLSPILIQSGTAPCRAKLPFVSNTYSENSILFSSVYIYQSIMLFFTIEALVVIDNLGVHMFNQITMNLKIFGLLLSDLGCQPPENRLFELHKAIKFHQHIISLTAKINDVYYYQYATQMIASTLIICLAGFEAMLAKDQLFLSIKFQAFMFAAFTQIFYWCVAGNLVYYNSLDIAKAAFEIDGWHEESLEFKQCLGLFIQRAQTPLIFQPKPLFSFSFETFVAILKTSYSYYTVLRTMSD